MFDSRTLLSGIKDYYLLQAASFPRPAAFHLPLQSQSDYSTKWTEWFAHQWSLKKFFAIHLARLCLKMMSCAFIFVKHQPHISQTQPMRKTLCAFTSQVWNWMRSSGLCWSSGTNVTLKSDRDKTTAVENTPSSAEKLAELYLKIYL